MSRKVLKKQVRVTELQVKVFLLKNIPVENITNQVCKLIDQPLIKDERFREFHNSREFKCYSFNSPYPIEKDKVYKEGNIYTFRLRTVNEELSDFLVKTLVNEYTDTIKVLTINRVFIKQRHIERVSTVTPLIAKFEFGYWKGRVGVEVLEKRIKENIIKKYNSFFNSNISRDFELFTMMTIKNKVPIKCKYKNISLLGDKIELVVADNKQAQDIMHFAIGAGLGELNSRGFGFINYTWM